MTCSLGMQEQHGFLRTGSRRRRLWILLGPRLLRCRPRALAGRPAARGHLWASPRAAAAHSRTGSVWFCFSRSHYYFTSSTQLNELLSSAANVAVRGLAGTTPGLRAASPPSRVLRPLFPEGCGAHRVGGRLPAPPPPLPRGRLCRASPRGPEARRRRHFGAWQPF